MSGDLRARELKSSALCFGVFSQHTFAGKIDQNGKREGNAYDRPE